MKELYQYYETQTLLPTYAGLSSQLDLERYAEGRRRFFNDKLKIPAALFRGARVIEFGPDSGENALVFGRWGARLTLVEPNAAAEPVILAYFDTFGLKDNLSGLFQNDVLTFLSEERFELLVAEGFIYTVQPTSAWLSAFARFLEPGGLAIVSYYERHGALMELMLKAIFGAFRRACGIPSIEAAHRLYDAKWNAIPHTRSFDAWHMDVLTNPFVRYKYFLDAASLCRQARAAGLTLYGSWPQYDDPLAIYWHKKILQEEDLERRREEHLARSALSFATGKKVYMSSLQQAAAAQEEIDTVLRRLDYLVDCDDPETWQFVKGAFQRLRRLADQIRPIADDGELAKVGEALRAFETVADLCGLQRWNELERFTNEALPFIENWGMPTHFAALQRH